MKVPGNLFVCCIKIERIISFIIDVFSVMYESIKKAYRWPTTTDCFVDCLKVSDMSEVRGVA